MSHIVNSSECGQASRDLQIFTKTAAFPAPPWVVWMSPRVSNDPPPSLPQVLCDPALFAV
eukprot:4776900-Pyramimonas_sp.AAC.1